MEEVVEEVAEEVVVAAGVPLPDQVVEVVEVVVVLEEEAAAVDLAAQQHGPRVKEVELIPVPEQQVLAHQRQVSLCL